MPGRQVAVLKQKAGCVNGKSFRHSLQRLIIKLLVLQSLKKMAKSKGIYVRILPEAVIDKNLWLTVVAEMLSHD